MEKEEKVSPETKPEETAKPEPLDQTTMLPVGAADEPASSEPSSQPIEPEDPEQHLSKFDQSIIGPANILGDDVDDVGVPEETTAPTETPKQVEEPSIPQWGTGIPIEPPSTSTCDLTDLSEKPGEDVAEQAGAPCASDVHAQPEDIAEEPLVGSEEAYVPPVSGPSPAGDKYWETPSLPPLPLEVNRDERTAAAIAHGSTLLNLVSGFGGILVALVIWLSYKDKSEYVRYQALQSMVFQLVALAFTIVVGIVAVVLIFVGIALSIIVVGVPIIILGGLLALLATLVPLAALVYGVVAAIQTYDGKDFRYWLVGELDFPKIVT